MRLGIGLIETTGKMDNLQVPLWSLLSLGGGGLLLSLLQMAMRASTRGLGRLEVKQATCASMARCQHPPSHPFAFHPIPIDRSFWM